VIRQLKTYDKNKTYDEIYDSLKQEVLIIENSNLNLEIICKNIRGENKFEDPYKHHLLFLY